jgi:hypothetical protein
MPPASEGGGGGASSLVLSAIMRLKPIETPSMTARRIAQDMAPFRIDLYPPRTASDPPVKNPAMMAFHGSSFFLMPLTAQSYVLKSPPQTPKLPPRTGARALIAVMAPIRRSPYGELRNYTAISRVEGMTRWHIRLSHRAIQHHRQPISLSVCCFECFMLWDIHPWRRRHQSH